jgi:hypothetical protein
MIDKCVNHRENIILTNYELYHISPRKSSTLCFAREA